MPGWHLPWATGFGGGGGAVGTGSAEATALAVVGVTLALAEAKGATAVDVAAVGSSGFTGSLAAEQPELASPSITSENRAQSGIAIDETFLKAAK